MERIAVISDIHGNMPALDAVEDDIRQRGIKRIMCLGDMVGKGPHSDMVVDRIRDLCEVVVQGNWDDFIGKKEDPVLIWHHERLGAERIHYLSELPFSYDCIMSGRLIRLFHASAKSVYHRVQPWSPSEERLAMFEPVGLRENEGSQEVRKPDVVGYGDVHNAFVQHLRGMLLFNPGSVGNPLDMPQASYAIIEGVWGSENPGAFSVQLVRVPYDIELAIRQAEEAHMPELAPYQQELRTAKYRGLS
ncbi:metallophosphoesterase family protein [Paenibacillus sp. GP183]|uniref:metallophosphoesterase family protein n=1 Tax=Paenibacillus sp. GP183 TaxID=1882751 RepID=UPI00089AEA77|nr:metallophosphoesterase family protein [Paenibacillus sp. GP183]SEB42517.1 phosphoesterase, MJ0936 family [Paenibacillus sp. GP183]